MIWSKAFVLTLTCVCYAGALKIEPHGRVKAVVEGSTLQLNCTDKGSVQWDYPNKDSAKSIAKVQSSGDNISMLTIENITKAQSGIYKCSGGGADVQVEVKVFAVMTNEPEFEFKEDAFLKCNSQDGDFTYSWKKGNTPVKDIKLEGSEGYQELENGTLQIKNPSRGFAGVYTCVLTFQDEGIDYNFSTDINYFAKPKVIPFEKSKNLVQDERLVIECRVLGYPKPTISWYKEGTKIGEDGGSHYKLSPANTYDKEEIENGKLEISSVDFEDAGQYMCMAQHDKWEQFNSTQSVLVRVKDKLAALWPFLGIVAEVIILCTIIFIYEKKRNKDVAEENAATEDGATPEKKSENVRHRGSTNNPRA